MRDAGSPHDNDVLQRLHGTGVPSPASANAVAIPSGIQEQMEKLVESQHRLEERLTGAQQKLQAELREAQMRVEAKLEALSMVLLKFPLVRDPEPAWPQTMM